MISGTVEPCLSRLISFSNSAISAKMPVSHVYVFITPVHPIGEASA